MNSLIIDESKERKNTFTNRYNVVLDRLIKDNFRSKSSFATKLGVDRSLISQIVNGHREASLGMKLKIAKELGVDSRTLFPAEEKNETK